MNLGENLTHTEQDIWRTFVFQEDGAVQQEQKIALG